MFTHYEVGNKIVVKLDSEVKLNEVKEQITQLMTSLMADYTIVFDSKGVFIKEFENYSFVNYEAMMSQVGAIGGRSRKSRAIDSEKYGT
ncbi:hypothetical protein [Pseudobacillus badius]|uniref:hypothetical protein n=1 Tax=Bacillus badius TaxID=1455 RepID=UPI0007B3F8E4|nr:hypothetical protein [Bacillus badius]KZR56966.1 hypothetical protein A3781_04640 [Bacillus badius]